MPSEARIPVSGAVSSSLLAIPSIPMYASIFSWSPALNIEIVNGLPPMLIVIVATSTALLSS